MTDESEAHALLMKIHGVSCVDGVYRVQIGDSGAVLQDWEHELNRRGGRKLAKHPIAALRELKTDLADALEYLSLDRSKEDPGTWDGNIGLTPEECRRALVLMG